MLERRKGEPIKLIIVVHCACSKWVGRGPKGKVPVPTYLLIYRVGSLRANPSESRTGADIAHQHLLECQDSALCPVHHGSSYRIFPLTRSQPLLNLVSGLSMEARLWSCFDICIQGVVRQFPNWSIYTCLFFRSERDFLLENDLNSTRKKEEP